MGAKDGLVLMSLSMMWLGLTVLVPVFKKCLP